MSRPTHQQQEALASKEFLAQNPGVAKGHLRTAFAKQETKRKWEDIALSLNSLGGAQKDGKGWAKYWADKKCALKKICSQHAQSMRRTGGGPADVLPSLSPLDLRLISVMGGPEFAAGDSHVAINPFPSLSQNNEIQISVNTEQEINVQHLELLEPVPDSSEISDTQILEPTPVRERSPVRTRSVGTRRRQPGSNLEQAQNRFEQIEMARVQAEAANAKAFSDAVNKLDDISQSIREGCRTLADALNNIAAALALQKNS